MSTTTPVLSEPGAVTVEQLNAESATETGVVDRAYRFLRAIPASFLWIIVLIWTLPTLGLAISSFRTRDAQRSSGWWEAITFQDLTLENYRTVLSSSGTSSLTTSLLNSMAIAVPATIIPIAMAAFAAYAFAWIDFKGRKGLFIVTVSLLAIPLQVALIPLLQLYVGGAHLTLPLLDKTITLVPDLDLAGSTTAVWLTHAGFAMPFAIFLLHNYISGLPKDLFEAARIDGADHFTIFWRLVLPLSVPVLAAFGIFQFLWTWNDYLIANTMIGNNPDNTPTTVRIANLAGDFGRNEFILPSAAFVQAFVPIIVFFALQRYFVRGILAGSVKGMTSSLVRGEPRQIGSLPPVGPLGYGQWRYTTDDAARAQSLVEAALDAGMNLVDTADVYGLDWGGTGFGEVEALLGRVLAGAPGLRDRMVLATKGGIKPPVPYDSGPDGLRSACEDSLRRLQVDVIDLYQIHRPDMFSHPAEVAATLAALRDEGKIREVGVSNHTPAQVAALRAHLPFPLVSNQPEYSAAHLDPLRDGTLDDCMRDGLVPLAWSPLAGGRLATGDGVRPELLAELDTIAERESVERSIVALAFVLAHPSAPVAIIGSQNTDRIAASTKALDVHLDRADVYRIVQASEGVPLP